MKDCHVHTQMLEYVGFDEIAIFHNRKPDFVKIKELRKS